MPRMIKEHAVVLNEKVIEDIVIAHLYAMNIIEDDDEVVEINLGAVGLHDQREINYKTIKNKEVELIVHS